MKNTCRRGRYGTVVFPANDQYVGRSFKEYGEFSELEVDIFRKCVKEGDLVVDIGANVGAHTLALSRIVGSKGGVYSLEPQVPIFYCLCATIALNGLDNVMCLNEAVGKERGLLYFPFPSASEEYNHGGVSASEIPIEGISQYDVICNPLDGWSIPAPVTFIKIDVEGMELEVLQGGMNFIAANKPTLYVECDRPEKLQDLCEELAKQGYDGYYCDVPLYNPNNYFGNRENLWPGIGSHNLLCVPIGTECPVEGLEKFWTVNTEVS